MSNPGANHSLQRTVEDMLGLHSTFDAVALVSMLSLIGFVLFCCLIAGFKTGKMYSGRQFTFRRSPFVERKRHPYIYWIGIVQLGIGCIFLFGFAIWILIRWPVTRSPEAKLQRRLTGTWAIEGRGIMTLGPDGTFSSRWTNTHAIPTAVWEYDGVWTVTNGACVHTITNSQSWGTTNREAGGSTDLYRILALDEHELVWESEGQTNSLTRMK